MPFFEYIPRNTVYHYTNITGFEGIIKSKSLWLSNAQESNDPREVKLGLSMIKEEIKKITNRDLPSLIIIDKLDFSSDIDHFHEISQRYICCFALSGDELPMWREYAEGGSGVAIGFRPTAISAIPGRVQLVRYADERIRNKLRQVAIEALAGMGASRTWQRVAAVTHAYSAATSLKHRSWAYEKEVRIVRNQLRHNPHVEFHMSGQANPQFDGPLPIWNEPLVRESGGRSIDYLSANFGRYRDNRADFARSIEVVRRGPHCTLSSQEIQSLMKTEGFSDFQVEDSECAIR